VIGYGHAIRFAFFNLLLTIHEQQAKTMEENPSTRPVMLAGNLVGSIEQNSEAVATKVSCKAYSYLFMRCVFEVSYMIDQRHGFDFDFCNFETVGKCQVTCECKSLCRVRLQRRGSSSKVILSSFGVMFQETCVLGCIVNKSSFLQSTNNPTNFSNCRNACPNFNAGSLITHKPYNKLQTTFYYFSQPN
jgi:hypothetical protein